MKIAFTLILAALGAIGYPALAANACCEEQEFRGVGVSPDGVKIQLVEVKRVSPEDIRVTWALRNTSDKPQVLTLGQGASWSDKFKLAYDANLLDSGSRLKIKVAKDQKGDLVAASHQPDMRAKGIVLGPGKTLTTWAKFIAPERVKRVSVDLPGATMPWEGVEVVQ